MYQLCADVMCCHAIQRQGKGDWCIVAFFGAFVISLVQSVILVQSLKQVLLRLSFPKTMQIAILVSRYHGLALCQSKVSDRLLAGEEVFLLIAQGRFQHDPHDIMHIEHWMLNRADRHSYVLSICIDDRNMLFTGCVRRIGLKLRPAFRAAIERFVQNQNRVGMTLETAKTRMNTGFFARPYCS